MSLMTPRFTYGPANEYIIGDRWGIEPDRDFNNAGDAREYARVRNNEFQSMLIVYNNHIRGEVEVRAVVPRNIWFGSTVHHNGVKQWFLKAIALDRGEPGPTAITDAIRDFPVDDILAWDVVL